MTFWDCNMLINIASLLLAFSFWTLFCFFRGKDEDFIAWSAMVVLLLSTIALEFVGRGIVFTIWGI